MIKYDNCQAFRFAAGNGHLQVIRQLLFAWSSEKTRDALIESHNYYAFKEACSNDHLQIAKQLYVWANKQGKERMRLFKKYDSMD